MLCMACDKTQESVIRFAPADVEFSIADVDVITILKNPGFSISLIVIGLIVAPWAERLLPFKRRRD